MFVKGCLSASADSPTSATSYGWELEKPKQYPDMKNCLGRRVVRAMVNVRGIPYVILHSMPPTSEQSDEQSRAYRKDSCCCVLDVAPTVLELMGVPTPGGMEGTPIKLISKEGAFP